MPPYLCTPQIRGFFNNDYHSKLLQKVKLIRFDLDLTFFSVLVMAIQDIRGEKMRRIRMTLGAIQNSFQIELSSFSKSTDTCDLGLKSPQLCPHNPECQARKLTQDRCSSSNQIQVAPAHFCNQVSFLLAKQPITQEANSTISKKYLV